jgi:hypothetical protein
MKRSYYLTLALTQQCKVNPQAKNAHAPGVLQYLRKELGISVPDPDHTPVPRMKSKGKYIYVVDDPRLIPILHEIERRDKDLYSKL